MVECTSPVSDVVCMILLLFIMYNNIIWSLCIPNVQMHVWSDSREIVGL